MAENITVVGIGASAGGLEALRALLSNVAEDTGLAFVVVQHLRRGQESHLGEILSKCSKIPVVTIADRMKVEPNKVFVVPPDFDAIISGNFFNLSKRGESSVHPLGIDFFFSSLAHCRKSRAIGVVLSGAGLDGTLGLKAIKSEGGISIVQDPKTARFDAMPRSAIAAGIVDLILKPESIGEELGRLAKHPYTQRVLQKNSPGSVATAASASAKSDAQAAIAQVLDILLSHTKIDFSQYKISTIQRRIERQMMLRKIETIEKFAEYLHKNPEEIRALYEDIFIHVTDFFRDPDAFEALRERVFPVLMKGRSPDQTIRIWVPGCATGEEAYSLAIVLLEFLQENGFSFPIHIFAGDISEPSLAKARKGVYADAQMGNVSERRLNKFFDKIKGGYKVKKALRDVCIFSQHDVTNNPPIPRVDLISCRNVLIYFSSDLQKRIFPVFHYALNPQGFLWLGRAENPDPTSKLFAPVDKTNKIFAKVQGKTSVQPKFSTSTSTYSSTGNGFPFRAESIAKTADSVRSADQMILFRYSPPSVVVDNNFDILQFRGSTAPYIEPAPGIASYNLLRMAHGDLLSALRSCLQIVKRKGTGCRKENIAIEIEGKVRRIHLDISLLNPMAAADDRQYLVVFEDHTNTTRRPKRGVLREPKKKKRGAEAHLEDIEQYNTQLLQELEAAREFQQSLVEEYEAAQEELTSANEELRSTNEELQSTNEELYSTNEELGTAKEELQATNEELSSTNEELYKRNAELERVILDRDQSEQRFEMMVGAVKEYAIFMLDPEGIVSTWNEGAKRIHGYEASEIIGEHFSRFYRQEDLLRNHPKEELKIAVRDGKYEEEGWRLRKDGSRFWANVVITALTGPQGHLRGFAKVTRDLTERREIEKAREEERHQSAKLEQVKKSEETLALIFDKSPSFMSLTLGPTHIFDRANQEYYETFEVGPDIIGKRIIEVFPEIEAQGFVQMLDKAYHSGKALHLDEALLRLRKADGTERLLFVDFVSQPIRNADGQIYGLVHHGLDVTAKVRARKAVENERENFRNLFEQTPEMVCILRGSEHVFEFVNEAHIRALGFDATGKSVREAQPESIEVHGILDEVYRTGVTASLHEIPVTLTNRLRYFNLTYSARRDEDGQIIGIMILGVEVTEQVQSRQALEDSRRKVLEERERFIRVAEATSLGVWYSDLPFADLVWNPKTKEHFWLPPDAHVTIDTFYDRIHPEDREPTRKAIEHSIKTQTPYDTEYRTINPADTSESKWIRAVGWTDYDQTGKPIRFDGITLDITAEREAIEEQKRNLEVLKSINEVGRTISAELDLSRLVQVVTDAATRLTGAQFGAFFYNVLDEKGEAYTLYTISGVPRSEFEKFPMPRNTAVFGPTFHGEGIVRSDDITKDPRYGKNSPYNGMPEGHLPVVSYLAVPVMSRSGKVLGGLFFGHSRSGVFTDREEHLVGGLAAQTGIAIDNANLFQQTKEAVQSRDQFMSIASHELRTPLTALKIQTHMFNRARSKQPGAPVDAGVASQFVHQIDTGLERLIRLIDDMLDISRIQHGRLALQLESEDLVSLVRDVLERLMPEMMNAGIKLNFRSPEQLFVRLDRFRFEQVVTNLVTNAVRYAPGAPFEVTIEKLDNLARVQFKDSGPGISKADQKRLFQRFERLVSPNKISGLGLGLYICKEIVAAHSGNIRIESEEQQGACFIVEVPLEGGDHYESFTDRTD